MPKLTKTMSEHLLTIAWDRSMESAHRLMVEKQVRHLAVTDEFGAITGILSSHDVSRAMHPSRPIFADGAVVCSYASSPVKSVPMRNQGSGSRAVSQIGWASCTPRPPSGSPLFT